MIRKIVHLVKHRKKVNQFLSFTAGGGYGFWGSINETESACLARLVTQTSNQEGPILEVGTLFGFTSQFIASHMDESTTLITIDNFSWNPFGLSATDHRQMTERTLYYLIQCGKVELYDGDSTDFYRSYKGPRPSLVFIDADHGYENVKRDIDWAMSQNVPIICGHDYADRHPGVKRAVDESAGERVQVEETLWYFHS